jgi:V8-like Glu-specific endopeptidase
MVNSYCTGTFISKRVLITAAHCAQGHDTSGVEKQPRIYYNGKAAELYITHPYKQWEKSPSTKIDVAIAVFKDDMAPSNIFAKISLAKVSKDDEITIAGFGVNDAADTARTSSGIKRYGYNVVEAVMPGEIVVRGVVSAPDADGKNSATGSGDSGGPIYNDNGEIIAVTSRGRILNGEKMSYLTALDSDYSRKVLCVALKQNVVIPGFPATECANFPSNKLCDYKYDTTNLLTGIDCK